MMDFKAQLRRQIRFIENSCRLYDDGHFEEAIRMAVTLRVLFHDTQSSISLLQHLKSKNISLLSTADLASSEQEYNLALVRGFVEVKDAIAAPKMSCAMRPVLDDPTRREFILIQTWWRDEPVVQLNGRESLNRSDLILAAANKDGGAHVDSQLEPIYNKVRLGADMKIEINLKTNPQPLSAPFENVHYASLRQMAYEVLNSPEIHKLAD